MKWNFLTAQNLALIDQEIENTNFTPAELEIVRRVILNTADFEYQYLLKFVQKPLQIGSIALVCSSSIIVDVPMVQAGIVDNLEKTFCNPIYCVQEINPSTAQGQKNKRMWALQTLLKRHPGAICIIGQNQLLLAALLELLVSEEVQPSLIISTLPSFVGEQTITKKFKHISIPHIRVDDHKGGVSVAVSIFNGLVDLAWLAYEEKFNNSSKF